MTRLIEELEWRVIILSLLFVSGMSRRAHFDDLLLTNQKWVLTLNMSAFSTVHTHQISIFPPGDNEKKPSTLEVTFI